MRAGTSLLEEQDIWSTKALFITNREATFAPLGRQQVLHAVCKLSENSIQPSQIRHSLAASAMDMTGIVRDELEVGRNRPSCYSSVGGYVSAKHSSGRGCTGSNGGVYRRKRGTAAAPQ